jgi:hypothetical protein
MGLVARVNFAQKMLKKPPAGQLWARPNSSALCRFALKETTLKTDLP